MRPASRSPQAVRLSPFWRSVFFHHDITHFRSGSFLDHERRVTDVQWANVDSIVRHQCASTVLVDPLGNSALELVRQPALILLIVHQLV